MVSLFHRATIKYLNVGSRKQRHTMGTLVFGAEDLWEIRNGSPRTGASDAGGVG